jgi:hypothetical protein
MDLSFEALRPEYEKLWLAIQGPGGLTRAGATRWVRSGRSTSGSTASIRSRSLATG